MFGGHIGEYLSPNANFFGIVDPEKSPFQGSKNRFFDRLKNEREGLKVRFSDEFGTKTLEYDLSFSNFMATYFAIATSMTNFLLKNGYGPPLFLGVG